MTEEKFSNILDVDIEEQMEVSYLDYAMSVIVSRALPDARDGLKPVHRRIIYGMNDLGLTHSKPHRKSAALVGDVMGKYHPHGDSAIYYALVRLAQPFSTRYPLADGQGNFGSIDGDSAAAMRYTEIRMSSLCEEMLRDIEKDTVDFGLNYDESLKEPLVLPSRFPNLLVNGSSGIAVGMATNMAPHNLDEVTQGVLAYIDNPEITTKELMEHIPGPDFPTGAYILGTKDIVEAYETGRGKIKLRAVAIIEQMKGNRERIVVTEIPYQVNKSNLIIKIADLVKDKRIEGISDIRDESDRQGMRIVIELKRDANAEVVLNNLYKHTQMQTTFGVINLALVNGQPKILSLKDLIGHYANHQEQVISRRTAFDLAKAKARAHIIEGLQIAIDNIDEIIKIIRSSYTQEEIKKIFLEKFSLSDKQSQAILDMQLKRLSGLERDKLEEEYKDLMAKIEYFESILADRTILMGIIKDELLEIAKRFADKRRTEIRENAREIDNIELIENEEVLITLTRDGYIKRQSTDNYKVQARGGKGIVGMITKEGDFVIDMIVCQTHDKILCFTEEGKVFIMYGHEVPEGSRQSRGTAIVNLLSMNSDEKIIQIVPIEKDSGVRSLIFATKKGTIKKTSVKEFENIRSTGIWAIKLEKDDWLISVRAVRKEKELMMVTQCGMSIRFKVDNVRSMGRTAKGVIGLRVAENDMVIAMDLIQEDSEYLLVVSENGYGKKTLLDHYNNQNRGGKGVKTFNINKKNGNLASAKVVSSEDDVLCISKNSDIIRLDVKNISTQGRTTSGVKLKDVVDDNKIVAVTKYVIEEE